MEDLLKDIKVAIKDEVSPVAAELKGVKEGVEKANEKAAEVEKRLEAIEKSPAIVKGAPGMVRSVMHRGFNVSKQLRAARELAHKNPSRFEALHDDEQTDEFVKGLIDFVAASVRKDPKAMADLYERNQKAIQQKAAYAEGANATGGYLVAPEYIWDMVMLAKSRTFMLDLCTVIPMGSNQLLVPSELTRPSLSWDSEASMTESEGTFGQVSLTAQRLSAYSLASNEMLADGSLDIASILAEQFGYGINLELDNQVLNGTGSPVSGVLTAAAGNSVVLGTGSTNFSAQVAGNYSEAIYQLNEADAANAVIVMNRISKHYVRMLRDTNGQHIYAQPGGNVPGTMFEIPVRVSETITNTSAASRAFAVVGDFKKFYIGRRLAFGSIEVDPYGAFTTYQTRFRAASRWALKIARSSAFTRVLTAAA